MFYILLATFSTKLQKLSFRVLFSKEDDGKLHMYCTL